MKRLKFLFLIVAMILSLSVTSLAEEVRTISVSGEAEVRAVPNEVLLSIGVESKDLVLDNAIKQNDERMRKIMAVIKRFDIEPKYIQTNSMEIRSLFDNVNNKKEFTGYLVNRNINLTVRNTDQFEAILKSLLQAGANNISGINFRTTEIRKYRDEARILAVRAAKEKAEMLAKELGQHVGKPRVIKEEPVYNYNGNSGWSNSLQDHLAPSQTGETFALGQIVITAKIYVEFVLLD